MVRVDPQPDDAQLEALYLEWLEASEKTPGLSAPRWVEEHTPRTLHRELLAVIAAGERALPEPLELAPGLVLGGDFELVEQIGGGGFGWVWRARQISLDRIVALKVLRDDGVRHLAPEDVEREARHLASIEHEGVVRVHTVGRDGGRVFFAMELVKGPSLADVLRRARENAIDGREAAARAHETRSGSANAAAIPARLRALGTRAGDRAAVELALALCDAVAAIHQGGLHHRDLKPANVLLVGDGRPKIADFGLSTLRCERSAAAEQPLYGTLDYLSPEELCAGAAGDPAQADVWALAVILYELLTLERPYGSGPRSEVLERARSGKLEDVCVHRPDLSPEIAAVCRKALAPLRADRYPDVASLRADLARLLRGEPVSVSTASTPRRVAMWARRHRSGVSFAAFGALLAASAGVVLTRPDAAAAGRARLAFEVAPPPPNAQRGIADYQRLPVGRVFEVERIDATLEGGSIEGGSILFVRLESRVPAYLYVFTRGASGRVFANFPLPEHAREGEPPLANPLAAGAWRVPIGRVGGAKGEERFFALALTRRNEQVEHLFALALGEDGSDQRRRMNEILNEMGRERLRDVRFDESRADPAAELRLQHATEWLWTLELERLRDLFNADSCFRWVILSR